jgi:hypothetical protein
LIDWVEQQELPAVAAEAEALAVALAVAAAAAQLPGLVVAMAARRSQPERRIARLGALILDPAVSAFPLEPVLPKRPQHWQQPIPLSTLRLMVVGRGRRSPLLRIITKRCSL